MNRFLKSAFISAALLFSGTSANASVTITVGIVPGSITTAKLENGAVTTPKINQDAVITSKIITGAVTTPKLATETVTVTVHHIPQPRRPVTCPTRNPAKRGPQQEMPPPPPVRMVATRKVMGWPVSCLVML